VSNSTATVQEDLAEIRRKSQEILGEALEVIETMAFKMASEDDSDCRSGELDELRDAWSYLGNRLVTQGCRYRLLMARNLEYPDFENGLAGDGNRW
jgi:hypothetical protein